MGKELINIRIELDRRDDGELARMAKLAERSKRLQARHVLRKVIEVWKSNPDVLRQIGITY